MLKYPLNRERFGKLNALETQAELFAQLESIWLVPETRKDLMLFLPKTAKYLEQANEYAKATLPTIEAGRTPTGEKRKFPFGRRNSEVPETGEGSGNGSKPPETLASFAEEPSEFVKDLAKRATYSGQFTMYNLSVNQLN